MTDRTQGRRGLSAAERSLLDELDHSRTAFAQYIKGLEAKLAASDEALRLANAACEELLREQRKLWEAELQDQA